MGGRARPSLRPALKRRRVPFTGPLGGGRSVYFEKIRVLKAGDPRLNSHAWNNGIGPRFYLRWFSEPEVMINRSGRGHSYFGVRGEILGSPKDGQLRKHLPRTLSLIKNDS